jgi:hypothetical protein
MDTSTDISEGSAAEAADGDHTERHSEGVHGPQHIRIRTSTAAAATTDVIRDGALVYCHLLGIVVFLFIVIIDWNRYTRRSRP